MKSLKLKLPVFTKLNFREIKPQGWLLNQLIIQAEGLSGNLDLFWPDIKDSKWIGGDREGWERVPYWLDGFLPLAYLIDNEAMKCRGQRYIDIIIENQREDGWICPCNEADRSGYDVWALFLILKVLVQYQEITEDPRIENVVRKALLYLDRHIDNNLLFSWAQARWFESLISIWWLYERTEEVWLLNLASKLHSQGFDWISFFKNWPYKVPDQKGRWSQMSHVVNIAMALKSGVLYSRMTGNEMELHSAEDMVRLLDQYHGMVTGAFTGDECLAGISPVQGTELCAIAEYMYSLEQLVSITGKAGWGDRLELLAYNALPAAFSPDMWTHQYVQQVNQVECSRQENPVFLTNGGESNLFGLEPNFGCCTSNLSQPWPKFAMNTCLRAEDGIAVIAYAPTLVDTLIDGVPASILIETDYPFRETVRFTVRTDKAIRFKLYMRLPEWCEAAAIALGEEDAKIIGRECHDGYYTLDRIWEKEISFTLTLPMNPKLIERPNQLYAMIRGPLIYSLAIEERWARIHEDMEGREYPHSDYEIYAATPWNYGLLVDPTDVGRSIKTIYNPVGQRPFSPEEAPVKIAAQGVRIDWSQENGSAAPKPRMSWVSDEAEELTFLPYGCTNLRLTELPLIKAGKRS